MMTREERLKRLQEVLGAESDNPDVQAGVDAIVSHFLAISSDEEFERQMRSLEKFKADIASASERWQELRESRGYSSQGSQTIHPDRRYV